MYVYIYIYIYTHRLYYDTTDAQERGLPMEVQKVRVVQVCMA